MPTVTRPRKVDYKKTQKFIEENPDKTLKEIGEKFKITDKAVIFNQWIEEFLIPELMPNQTVILDNAAFHKSPRTTDLIKSANCSPLYLPPYSPDFNPIEHKWGHVKNSVKKIRDGFENFTECLERVLCRQ